MWASADPAHNARLPKRGHRPVPGVGPRGCDPPPADMSAGPIALTCGQRPAELGDRHRQPSTQCAAWTAIVRDSRLGGQARARQHAHGATTNQLTKSLHRDGIHAPSMPGGPTGTLSASDSHTSAPCHQDSPSKSLDHHRRARPAASSELTGHCCRDQQTLPLTLCVSPAGRSAGTGRSCVGRRAT